MLSKQNINIKFNLFINFKSKYINYFLIHIIYLFLNKIKYRNVQLIVINVLMEMPTNAKTVNLHIF